MGIFDFFRTKKETDESTSFFGFASKEAEEGKGLDQAQIQKFQTEFLSILDTNDEQKAVNFAANLMGKGAFQPCIEAYQKLCEKYPHRKGTFEGQIGAAYFFLGDYEQAIQYYLQARANDASNADMMDDNIWEACETIYNEQGKREAVEQYKLYCPNGKYLKKADAILKK
jgi:tetratricopeptide (TPR) repeat protein